MTLTTSPLSEAKFRTFRCMQQGLGRLPWQPTSASRHLLTQALGVLDEIFDPASDWYPFSFVDLKCALKWCGWTTSTITITCITAKSVIFGNELFGFANRRFLMWISWESRSGLQQCELIGFGFNWFCQHGQALEKPVGITCCSKKRPLPWKVCAKLMAGHASIHSVPWLD